MFDMCRFLDGRLWPEQDKTDVQLFLQLMKHVTGEASAAACCILAPSAALASWSVMIATADERRDRRGCRWVPAVSFCAAVLQDSPEGLQEGWCASVPAADGLWSGRCCLCVLLAPLHVNG